MTDISTISVLEKPKCRLIKQLDEMDPECLKLNHALGYNGSVRSAKNKYTLFPPLLYLNNDLKKGINGLFIAVS